MQSGLDIVHTTALLDISLSLAKSRALDNGGEWVGPHRKSSNIKDTSPRLRFASHLATVEACITNEPINYTVALCMYTQRHFTTY